VLKAAKARKRKKKRKSTECQFAGNHFTRGTTLSKASSFVMLLSTIVWTSTTEAERKKHKSLSQLQEQEKNDYALCKSRSRLTWRRSSWSVSIADRGD
jgi:hypothetical protein